MFFLICITYPRQDESPDGRAERQGMPELQPKFNQICTYEYIVFSYVCAFIRQKEWPDGRAQRRGVPELQPKLDQLCLYEYVVFRITCDIELDTQLSLSENRHVLLQLRGAFWVIRGPEMVDFEGMSWSYDALRWRRNGRFSREEREIMKFFRAREKVFFGKVCI